MPQTSHKFFLCLIFGLLLIGPLAAPAHSQTQFLVLKNGHEIEGVIVQDAQQTVVQTASGSKLFFPNDKVDFVSPNLSAAYWQKVARVGPTDAKGHIELFHWCLDRSMHEQAGNQIKLLMEMEVSAIKLEFLLNKLTHERKIASQPKTKSNDLDNQIRQVNFEEAAGPSMPTAEEIHQSAAGLTPDAISHYKRRVEPLLIRSCYTAGCHDTKATVMPLRHLPGNKVVPKRMSQANLHEVLKHIDSTRPFKNPFFAAAVDHHADQDKPIIRRGSKQFETLRQWLVLISNQPFDFHSAAPVVDFDAPKPNTINRLEKPASSNFAAPPRVPVLKPEPPQPALQKDPFDPNLFNRKYGSGRAARKKSSK